MLKNVAYAYDRFCRERFEPASEDQITDLERKIGVELPGDFKEYLRLYNGGRFDMPDFATPDSKCPKDCLKTLFGVGGPGDFANLSSVRNLSLFDNNRPAIILPIGVTIMNNLILLRTEVAAGRGNIALKLAFKSKYYFVAESIDVFFGLLEENPEA